MISKNNFAVTLPRKLPNSSVNILRSVKLDCKNHSTPELLSKNLSFKPAINHSVKYKSLIKSNSMSKNSVSAMPKDKIKHKRIETFEDFIKSNEADEKLLRHKSVLRNIEEDYSGIWQLNKAIESYKIKKMQSLKSEEIIKNDIKLMKQEMTYGERIKWKGERRKKLRLSPLKRSTERLLNKVARMINLNNPSK